MTKEFVYTKVQDLGKIGDKTVEIGHYIVDGKVMPDKVYMVNHFTRKNGTEDSKATAIETIGEDRILKYMFRVNPNKELHCNGDCECCDEYDPWDEEDED